MQTPRRQWVVVLLALVAVLGGGLWLVLALSADLREARDRWESREPAAYSYRYSHCGGMCAYCPVRVTVRDGEVTDAVAEEPGCAAPEPDAALTIEDLFEVAEDHQPWPFSDSTAITYDGEWGFPSLITTTCGPGTADCGSSWSATDLAPLS